MSKYFDIHLTAQRFNEETKAWDFIPSSALSDPRNESDWIRLFPLRINLFSDAKMKAGCATNCNEFCAILETLEAKARLPYGIGERAEKESGLKRAKVSRDPSVFLNERG